MKTPAGPPARQHLIDLLSDANGGFVPLILRTVKDRQEKFWKIFGYPGRYLAVLFRGEVGGVLSINQLMIDDGFAVPYMPTPGPALGTL